jgi:hypothetical protein
MVGGLQKMPLAISGLFLKRWWRYGTSLYNNCIEIAVISLNGNDVLLLYLSQRIPNSPTPKPRTDKTTTEGIDS